jgi:hypothetical protein
VTLKRKHLCLSEIARVLLGLSGARRFQRGVEPLGREDAGEVGHAEPLESCHSGPAEIAEAVGEPAAGLHLMERFKVFVVAANEVHWPVERTLPVRIGGKFGRHVPLGRFATVIVGGSERLDIPHREHRANLLASGALQDGEPLLHPVEAAMDVAHADGEQRSCVLRWGHRRRNLAMPAPTLRADSRIPSGGLSDFGRPCAGPTFRRW